MSQSELDKLTTVGTEFNYWGGARTFGDTVAMPWLRAKVIGVKEGHDEHGLLITVVEEGDHVGAGVPADIYVHLGNIDKFDIDWDTPSPDRGCWSESVGKAIRFLECLKPYSKNLLEMSNEEHEQYDEGLHSILRDLRFFRTYLEKNFPEGLGEK